MTMRKLDAYEWSADRDDEGHRTYNITFHVETDDPDDGPALAMQCPGLPRYGDIWAFGNDIDVWAWCRHATSIKRIDDQRGPGKHWAIGKTFSTKPNDKGERGKCSEDQIEDPLLEPQKVSGTFTKYTEEAVLDFNGNPIVNGAFEVIRGPANEWDAHRPVVTIEQNVPALQMEIVAGMIDRLNNHTLWGLTSRKIKLSSFSWDQKFYGSCYKYYTRKFEFEIKYDGWDRQILNEATKVLNGHWAPNVSGTTYSSWITDNIGGASPNPANPNHFIKFKDRSGEYAKVILDSSGRPSDVYLGTGSPVGTTNIDGTGDPSYITVQRYGEANFLLLGIPTIL